MNTNKPLTVLSLFDGISCAHLALDRAGIAAGKYYAAEIDKWAIKCTQHNYPDTIQLGDVSDWRSWDICWEDIDIVFGGFPCQSHSTAGTGKGFDDPRGQLFFVMCEIIQHINKSKQVHNPESFPVKFLAENVKMKQESQETINSAIGVKPTFINSCLVSAQNRQRLYWTNLLEGNIPQPGDKGITLQEIVEDGYVDRDKSYCIDASYYKGGDTNQYFNKSRRQLVFSTEEVRDLCKEDLSIRGWKGSPAYRKLTPLEVERLQTVPEGYTSCLSNTQRYKTLGNGWTVDVITHILNSSLNKGATQ